MFKEALREMNVALADLLLRCFKVDANELLPGPWMFPYKHHCNPLNNRTGGILPLELAILAKHALMVRVLVRWGANIFSTNRYNYTMVVLALDSTPEILQILLGGWVASDPPSGLLRAVCLGLSADVEMLVAHGIDPNTCDNRFGGPALAVAIRTEYFHIAHLLLNAGAEVNVFDQYGDSPLFLAVDNENCELVHRLLKHGADPDGKSNWRSYQSLPMDAAVGTGNTYLAELLLKYGAYLDGDNYLSNSIYYNKSDMIQLFLDLGVPPSFHTFGVALSTGNLDFVKRWLDTGSDINAWDTVDRPRGSQPMTILTMAIDQHNASLEMVSFLVDSGADINHPEASPTALEIAIRWRNTELISFLLERNARLDDAGLLEAAVRRMEHQFLRKLMDSITTQGIIRQSCCACFYHPALAAAAESGTLENVEIILEQAIGIATPCSVCALQVCKSDNLPVLRRLLKAGIPVNIPPGVTTQPCFSRNLSGLPISPTQHFAMSGNDQAVQLLLDYGADPSYRGAILQLNRSSHFIDKMESVMSTVAANCGTAVLEAVLKAGAIIDPQVLGTFERTPLQNAAEHGKLENLELLLRAGGDVNAPAAAYGGVTALQATAISGYLGIAIRLLEAGADVNAPMAEEEGRTALEGAAEHGRIDMIQLLLSAGADIESPQFGILQYERAVKRARENGHNAAARLLEKHRSRLRPD